MQCKQMLPLMWCSSSEQRGASDVACCVFHQASSWVSLLNGAYWAPNRMVWKQVCLVSWQPSWGVCCGQGGAQPGCMGVSHHQLPLRLCQQGDFAMSLSASTASASPVRLSQPAWSTSLQRWKPLTIFLHRCLFAWSFLVWSSALCSDPGGPELGDLQGTLPGSFASRAFP